MTGLPLGDLPHLVGIDKTCADRKARNEAPLSVSRSKAIHSPASITFVRNRMLYARAALNAQSKVRFGLRHIRMFLALDWSSLLTIQMSSIDFRTSISPNLVRRLSLLI
jgi:hypothetical protein